MPAVSPAKMPLVDPFRLDGRVALVTGASAGLGARFARVLSDAGAAVVLVARRADRLADLAGELPDALAVPADLADPDQRAAAVQAALDRHGRVDVLVNNAGISDGPQRAETEDPADFALAVEVNLTAAFHLARLVVPGMIERGGGSIVNVTSVHGLVASSPNRQAGYVASKSGLVGLTKELACQWATSGVRVNALAPGYFATDLTGEMIESESGRTWIERNTPMRRIGADHELDGALLFLASDASTYVTGQTLAVDGGWTAR
jgi:NAD(P)-dependent dehydrogenase (short-subunit alcohol dehydrogenase family)